MTDSPGLIGRHRVGYRGIPLGVALPAFTRPPLAERDLTPTIPKTADELRAERDARRDAEPMTARCAFCPSWRFDGLAGECREAARAHREQEHPAARNRVGRRRSGSWRKDTSEQATLDRKAANAARQEREDADRLATIMRGRQRDAA